MKTSVRVCTYVRLECRTKIMEAFNESQFAYFLLKFGCFVKDLRILQLIVYMKDKNSDLSFKELLKKDNFVSIAINTFIC